MHMTLPQFFFTFSSPPGFYLSFVFTKSALTSSSRVFLEHFRVECLREQELFFSEDHGMSNTTALWPN